MVAVICGELPREAGDRGKSSEVSCCIEVGDPNCEGKHSLPDVDTSRRPEAEDGRRAVALRSSSCAKEHIKPVTINCVP